jgi:hypothetical protein
MELNEAKLLVISGAGLIGLYPRKNRTMHFLLFWET